jgi:exodeoxyribonuclease-3
MKIITWNVNGIRTKIFNKKTSQQLSTKSEVLVDEYSPIQNLLSKEPDFMCFQETRCSIENGKKFKIPGYNSLFNQSNGEGARSCNRYSGTCIFYKDTLNPISVENQIPGYIDNEGRIIIMHFENFTIINVYTPNSGTNFQNRLQWQECMLNYLKTLQNTVYYVGDLNVAWRESDVHFHIKESPTYRKRIDDTLVGFLPEERSWIHELIGEGFVDSYMNVEDKYDKFSGFTYWDARSRKIAGLPGARYNRHGWRLDYIFVKNKQIIDSLTMSNIGVEYIDSGESQSSDHCPLFTETD